MAAAPDSRPAPGCAVNNSALAAVKKSACTPKTRESLHHKYAPAVIRFHFTGGVGDTALCMTPRGSGLGDIANDSEPTPQATKILLVEDSFENRDMLTRRLQRRGFTVCSATDGSTGVAMSVSEMPDVILMDVALGEMDGWQATQLIKADARTSDIPIIALTAHSADRGHPFQADRGQRSGRSRTPWVRCLSDGPDGRATVRHQRGTLSAISVERGLPGYPRGALAPGG